jgi:hypothetical protein
MEKKKVTENYVAPQLRRIGSVAVVTRSVGGSMGNDNAQMAPTMTS